MENEALTIIEPKDALAINRAPDVVLEEAQKAAQAIKKVIDGKQHKVVLNARTYLQFEDWQTLGRFYGVTVIARSTKYVEYGDGDEKVKGFEACADALLVGNNQVISSAEAMCLNDEQNWSRKPLFQLKSMAQTRACAKALRNVLAWVVVLAGYSPTPAEEMEEVGTPVVKPPKRRSEVIPAQGNDAVATAKEKGWETVSGRFITEGQQKRLFAIAKEKGWEKDKLRELLGRYGCEHSAEIPKAQYESLVAEIV